MEQRHSGKCIYVMYVYVCYFLTEDRRGQSRSGGIGGHQNNKLHYSHKISSATLNVSETLQNISQYRFSLIVKHLNSIVDSGLSHSDGDTDRRLLHNLAATHAIW